MSTYLFILSNLARNSNKFENLCIFSVGNKIFLIYQHKTLVYSLKRNNLFISTELLKPCPKEMCASVFYLIETFRNHLPYVFILFDTIVYIFIQNSSSNSQKALL